MHDQDVLGALLDQNAPKTTLLAELLKDRVLDATRPSDTATSLAQMLVTEYPTVVDPADAVGLLAYGLRQVKLALAEDELALGAVPSQDKVSWADAYTAVQVSQRDKTPLVDPKLSFEAYNETQFDWRTSVMESFTRVRSALDATGEDTEYFDAINWDGSFPSIRASLHQLQSDYRPAVERQAGELDPAAYDSIKHIKNECRNANFGVCVPILGEWGSGRSRLLVELARIQHQRDQWALLIDTAHQHDSIVDQLLDGASRLFGFAINELRHLATELVNADKNVLIGIDNAERLDRADLVRLSETISALTMCPRLRWVVTADALRYDALSRDGLADFWTTYGLRRETGISKDWYMSGWLNLDAYNDDTATGWQILVREVGLDRAEDLQAIRTDPSAFGNALKLLNNPLPAWVQSESLSGTTEDFIADVYRRSFISRYWAKLCAAVAAETGDERQIEDLVTLWARHIFAPQDCEIPLEPLLEVSCEALQEQGITLAGVRHIAESLCDYGIVDIVDEGDREIAPATKMLSPAMDVLWGYRIARIILADGSDSGPEDAKVSTALKAWGMHARLGDALAESVSQFGLSLLPWGTEHDVNTSLEVWRKWLNTAELPDLPLQLASTSAHIKGEEVIIERLRADGRSRTRTIREVFVLLRFALLARSTTWTADQRLSAIRHYYAQIGDAGLGHYAAHVVRNMLERADIARPDRMVECLDGLRGTENAGFAAAAAAAVLEYIDRVHRQDVAAWLQRLSGWLFTTDKATRFPKRPERADLRRAEVDIALGMDPAVDIYCFWEHLVQQACRRSVRRWGFDAVGHFRDASLLNPGEPPFKHVKDRIDDELNVAIGAHFRDHQGVASERGEFLALLSALIAGTALATSIDDQRVRAFFMIRHTKVTSTKLGVRVDQVLRGPLATVCADPSPVVHGRIKPWKKPMMEANDLA